MDVPTLSWSSLLLIAALFILFFFLWRRESKTRHLLPPGSPSWPIVGNLFHLRKRPHQSLYALSLKYGPLMSLHLGIKTTMVVSSPPMAKEFLKTHDHIFVRRIVLEAFKSHKSSLVWGQYGAHWRHLRHI
ncbi:hypothetical protein SUGI_0648760 [Cryptomeria japonica]|nr:hypothetical protein SUGI_0648760 [Cryptomeria japonica]